MNRSTTNLGSHWGEGGSQQVFNTPKMAETCILATEGLFPTKSTANVVELVSILSGSQWISRHVFGHQSHNISSNISDHVGSQKLFVGTNPKWPDPKLSTGGFKFFHQSSQTSQVWLKNQSRGTQVPKLQSFEPRNWPPWLPLQPLLATLSLT